MPRLFPWRFGTVVMIAALLSACAIKPSRPSELAEGDYGAVKEYLQKRIPYDMRKHKVMGVSIALVDDQQLVWAQGFGYADRAADKTASPQTVYRLGSISKLFTAMAAMQLQEREQFDIDARIQHYLPEFSMRSHDDATRAITARQLMTHHSGLPTDIYKGMWTDAALEDVPHILREEYLAYPPDFNLCYSNIGVSLLGLALAKTVQREFADWMRETVLQPLGMTHSSFIPRADLRGLYTRAYRDGKPMPDESLRDLPAGGLHANVLDVSRFVQMILAEGRTETGRLLQPESVREMLRAQNGAVELDLDQRIGLAWMLSGAGFEYAGGAAFHGGGTLYQHSQLIVVPQHKLGVVVLSNSSEGRALVDSVARDALQLAIQAKTGLTPPEATSPRWARHPPPAQDIERFRGHYATMLGLTRIEAQGEKLRARVAGADFDILPRADGDYGVRLRLFGWLPANPKELRRVKLRRAAIAGREVLVVNEGELDVVFGERLEREPIPAAWQARLGDYDILDPDEQGIQFEEVALREVDGFLVLEYRMPQFAKVIFQLPLRAVSDRHAIVAGLGRSRGDTLRVEGDADAERLRLYGFRLAHRPPPK